MSHPGKTVDQYYKECDNHAYFIESKRHYFVRLLGNLSDLQYFCMLNDKYMNEIIDFTVIVFNLKKFECIKYLCERYDLPYTDRDGKINWMFYNYHNNEITKYLIKHFKVTSQQLVDCNFFQYVRTINDINEFGLYILENYDIPYTSSMVTVAYKCQSVDLLKWLSIKYKITAEHIKNTINLENDTWCNKEYITLIFDAFPSLAFDILKIACRDGKIKCATRIVKYIADHNLNVEL